MSKFLKTLVLVSLSFLFVIPAFARKKSDIEEIPASNINSWQEEFDLEAKKPGKYNIMITATDLGGNVYIEGPHNIMVDPNSDLPKCGITNPYPDMRVVGNLNIVGTCVDDDGVSKVELVLDEGTDHEKTVLAQGTEFWSYYLDTNDLEEGAHTIRVIGYDINDEPKTNYYNQNKASDPKNTILTWQLDRKQPLTTVLDRSMGMLVSGNQKFHGTVEDGNGIKELSFSVDGGKTFKQVKLKRSKDFSICEFDFSIDTKKFQDGPAVLWFKAIDRASSVGLYSFLFFIDNKKPDVKIVYPAENQVMNGKFSVAGFAKDEIGVKELSWTFGDLSGTFDLVPGNPYWCVDLDTIGKKDKSSKFVIHAVDSVDNVVDVTMTIPLNQEDDKPIVSIVEPENLDVFGQDKRLIVRGIATDDDEVQSVQVQLDSKEAIVQETKGDFYFDLGTTEELSAGVHKITVTATDINGVVGNPLVTSIDVIGLIPQFNEGEITVNKETTPFVNGYEIHPESGALYTVKVESGVGIKQIDTILNWGSSGSIENTVELKNVSSYKVDLPITAETPKGLIHYTIIATDTRDRTNKYESIFYVTNTSVVKSDELQVVLSDSRIADDGSIINNRDYPATAYLIGGKAASVELIPETPFAKAQLVGNQIKLIPGKHDASIGSSEPVKIRVITDKGHEVYSREIIFKDDTAFPKITITGANSTKVIDARSGKYNVSGKITCPTGIGKAEYRILSAPIEIKGGVISSFKAEAASQEFNSIRLSEDGSYSFNVETSAFNPGIYVVEIVAQSAGGNQSTNASAISIIPDVEEVNGKMPAVKAPLITFVDGSDVYGLVAYQGDLDKSFEIFPREEMSEGINPLLMTIIGPDEKEYSGKFNAVKAPSLEANIAMVNDSEYLSGMNVILPYNSSEAGTITVDINTSATVNSVSYEFSGAEVPGGKIISSGSAKLTKPTEDNPAKWTATIPVLDLPSRINNFTVSIKADSLEKSLKGSIAVIRQNDKVDDVEKIYQFPASETLYQKAENSYVLRNGSEYYFYANCVEPKAEIINKKEGLSLKQEGKLFILTANKDGYFTDVGLKVIDKYGDVYESEKVNFISDLKAPEVVLLTPVLHQWLGQSVKISGTAVDVNGIKSVEYSFDYGKSWQKMDIKGPAEGVTFEQEIELSKTLDGLVSLSIRVTDKSDAVTNVCTSCYKDTTAPEVSIVEPLPEDVVNGQNLIVFEVKDNAYLKKAEYLTPPQEGHPVVRKNIAISPLVSAYIGTEECPIDEAMSFDFTDDAGNIKRIEAWDFIIDNESDLPRSEIHVPEDMQVITRDFTISGVIYDDDGDSSIFYKIDDGDYRQLPEMGTSFAIDVPLSTMTDNEHTVTVYAVDINGVKGNETSRTFRISLEEPKGAVELPTIDTSVRELITISGWASDKNGIAKVEVSLDNGNSFNDAVGTEEWSYVVDTRAIPGGTQVVFLRVTDNYGITGLYSSLINIDNDAPGLNLELPIDDSSTTGALFFSGNTYDNVEVTDLNVTIRNLEKTSEAIEKPLNIDRIIGQVIDISDLEDGFYNVEVTAKDKAGNITNVSRNIHLEKNKAPAVVDILYPLNGEHKQGIFTIYGQANAENDINALRLFIDQRMIAETQLTGSGFYKFDITPEIMPEGPHTYRVDAVLSSGQIVPSREQTVTYNPVGPWVTIDNFTYGDFATNRPYIRGQAGYSIGEDDLLFSKTKEASPEFKAEIASKQVAKVEISFDNGKTFTEVSKAEKWMYRVENQDLPEGYHFMLVRATMKNHEVAVTRTIIQIDNINPSIKLISPAIGGAYNQKLEVSGLSRDDVQLEDVMITLRKGDKASYEVPSFIQGLYLDFHFWGATLFDIGAGLTFFDDVVKLQFQWGQFTQEQRDAASKILKRELTNTRYGGENIMGVKILANVATLPFSFLFGHDWEWLSAAAALGAQFTWFDLTTSKRTQALSAILAQLEFPKIKLNNVKMFSSFAFYTEGSLWFIPTDVQSTVEIKNKVFQIAVGVRTNVF